ncbi:MAG: hypothetical protein WC683_01300 [bacterium]
MAKKWMVQCEVCGGKGEVAKECPSCGMELDEGQSYCDECDTCRECCSCPQCDVCKERGEACRDYELIDGARVCADCYDDDVPTQRQVDREAYEEDLACWREGIDR